MQESLYAFKLLFIFMNYEIHFFHLFCAVDWLSCFTWILTFGLVSTEVCNTAGWDKAADIGMVLLFPCIKCK